MVKREIESTDRGNKQISLPAIPIRRVSYLPDS